jgi:hypothetical protein
MTDSTAVAAAEAERSFDTLQAQAQQAQADADAKAASQGAEPKARPTAAERLADALKTHAPAPEGYQIRWPKGGYDLLKANAQAPEGSPAWLVRCNAHGTTTPAANGKAGDKLGTTAGRLTWCRGCKAEAARAEAKAQEPRATTQAKAPRTSRAKAEPKAQETTQA